MNPTSFQWYFLNKIVAIALILFSGSLLSCEKDPEPLTTNSCINGHVFITGSTFGEVPEIKVTAIGPYGTLSTYSDNEGEFWFRNVGNGTYNLECSLEGYGTVKKFGVQVFGSDTARVNFASLNPLPDKNLRVPEFLEITPGEFYTLTLRTNGTDCGYYENGVRFFFSTESEVSNENYVFSTFAFLTIECKYYIDLVTLYYIGYPTGTKFYLVGYVCDPNDTGYLDMYRNILIHPTVNLESKSEVISFILQ